MKLFSKKNLLDEMQEQKLREIESNGFWITWVALLAVMTIQVLLDKPVEQWMGEWVVFMGVSIYAFVRCLVNGIWERHNVASTPNNVAWSLAAGAAVVVITWLQNHYLPGALMTGGCTGILCFVVLQVGVALYKRRRHSLDADEPETGEEDTSEEE